MFCYFTKNGNTLTFFKILSRVTMQPPPPLPHRSKVAPQDVTVDNEADIWAFKTTEKNLNITPYHYKIGDFTRISHRNMVFDRSYDEHFTREIFKVSQRMRMQGIPVYNVVDFMNEGVRGNLYESEMQKVNKDEDALWFVEKKLENAENTDKLNGWLTLMGGLII